MTTRGRSPRKNTSRVKKSIRKQARKPTKNLRGRKSTSRRKSRSSRGGGVLGNLNRSRIAKLKSICDEEEKLHAKDLSPAARARHHVVKRFCREWDPTTYGKNARNARLLSDTLEKLDKVNESKEFVKDMLSETKTKLADTRKERDKAELYRKIDYFTLTKKLNKLKENMKAVTQPTGLHQREYNGSKVMKSLIHPDDVYIRSKNKTPSKYLIDRELPKDSLIRPRQNKVVFSTPPELLSPTSLSPQPDS